MGFVHPFTNETTITYLLSYLHAAKGLRPFQSLSDLAYATDLAKLEVFSGRMGLPESAEYLTPPAAPAPDAGTPDTVGQGIVSAIRSAIADAVLEKLGILSLVEYAKTNSPSDEAKAKAVVYEEFLNASDFESKVLSAKGTVYIDLSR